MTAPAASGGLRERKKQQTFEALRDAAVRRFATYGYDATTIAEIADDANVSLRTFFRYFRCKEALLFRTDDEARQLLVSALQGRPADEPVLVSLREALAEFWKQNRREDDERRRIRDELFVTHPSVAAYAVESLAPVEAELAAFAAARLRSAADDPEPQVFAQLCTMLMGRALVERSAETDPVERVDRLLAGLTHLVDQAKAR